MAAVPALLALGTGLATLSCETGALTGDTPEVKETAGKPGGADPVEDTDKKTEESAALDATLTAKWYGSRAEADMPDAEAAFEFTGDAKLRVTRM